ncbi:TrkA family potassium uptake protein [Clostridium cadaveris]|uniref:potassium channel family protein n=1 Tax=Clostridium cadaveris TaxID=1529 RepID=UPI001E28DC40|nr:TrkA family potassium uptake protein [Clostridium cadaveris]UFH65477.1 TrkA family potassium uptake protein [Clostridium cadaveris]
MRAVIVGGGKVGYYLVKSLLEKKYEVILIEKDADICNKIANDLNIDVIHGDGSNLDELSEAIEWKSDVVAAVTGKDEENIIICQMAKQSFSIKKTIARINNPKNREVFKKLGVDTTVCSTDVISKLIENELNSHTFKVIQTFERGEMVLVEAIITSESNWLNKTIQNINLPEESVIVSVIRNDNVIYPRGPLVLLENDHVIVMTNFFNENNLKESIFSKRCNYA